MNRVRIKSAREASAIVASKATVNGIAHPFDVTFDTDGSIYTARGHELRFWRRDS